MFLRNFSVVCFSYRMPSERSPESGGARAGGGAVSRRAALTLLVCFLASACQREVNTARKRPETLVVGSSELRTISVDSSVNELQDLAIASSGIWAVIRDSHPVVHYAWASGRRTDPVVRGDGPSDVGGTTSVSVTPEGRALIWDDHHGTIVTVDSTGIVEVLRSSDWLRSPIRGRRFYYLGGVPNQAALLGSEVVVGKLDSFPFRNDRDFKREVIVKADSADPEVVVARHGVAAGIDSLTNSSQDLSPFPLWTPCGTSQLADYDPVSQRVNFIDGSGDTVSNLEVTGPRRALTDDDKRLYGVIQIRKGASGRIPEEEIQAYMRRAGADSAIKTWSSAAPSYVELLCTPGGVAWLNRFELTDTRVGRSPTWDVLGENQRWSVTFPEGFRLFDVNDTLLVGASTDSLGIVTIQALNTRQLGRD